MRRAYKAIAIGLIALLSFIPIKVFANDRSINGLTEIYEVGEKATFEIRKYTFMDCIWLTVNDYLVSGNINSVLGSDSVPELLRISYMIYESIPQEINDTRLFDEIYNGIRYCQRSGFGDYKKLHFESVFSDFHDFAITFRKEKSSSDFIRVTGESGKAKVFEFLLKLVPAKDSLSYNNVAIVKTTYDGKQLDMDSIHIAWECIYQEMLNGDAESKLAELIEKKRYDIKKITKFSIVIKSLKESNTNIYEVGLTNYLIQYYLSCGNVVDMKQFIVLARLADQLLTSIM